MDEETFLRRLPKVDLHCHLGGTVRPATLIELGSANGVSLRTHDPTQLYEFADFYDFLDVLRATSRCLVHPGDFARVSYEALADAATAGNLKYAELFFNPTDYLRSGVSYRTVVDGFIEGLSAAESDHGVSARLIPSLNRELGPDTARAMLDEVLAHRRDEVVGIGMDGAERDGPPELFAGVYRAAKQAGLRRTAHACEDNQTLHEAPPANVARSLDELDCDRIDHGYNVLADPALVCRCRDESVTFTVCSHTCVPSRLTTRWNTLRRMAAADLRFVVCTDDPPMYGTDIGTSYVTVARELNLSRHQAAALAVNAIDGTWLDDTDKHRLRREFTAEISALNTTVDRPQ